MLYWAALTAILLLGSAVQAEETDMEKLNVNLGFSQVPDNYTCKGSDISPRIVVGGMNAVSMAVTVVDVDAPSGIFTHWLAWNIPPTELIPEAIPQGAKVTSPIQAVQGTNSFGKIGYAGPCPPPGKPHRYFFRVYGLDSLLDLQPGADRQSLENAMKGHVLKQGEAMATYQR
jgi:Raf kinase inhibitor-like YbhB/YbcL family protein